jgi:hypothetical protein
MNVHAQRTAHPFPAFPLPPRAAHAGTGATAREV